MAKLRRRQLRLLIEAQGELITGLELCARLDAKGRESLQTRVDSLTGAHESLRTSGEAHRVRAANFGAILTDVANALPVVVENWAHLPAAVRDAIAGSGEAEDELHRLGILLDEARTEAGRRGALVLHVIDALPCGALSLDDVPAAVAAYTAELREERQAALSRAAESERRQLAAERLAAQFGSRLTPGQRADARAALDASEADNG